MQSSAGGGVQGVSAMSEAGLSKEGAFGVGGVLGRTFRIWGRNVLPFAGVALLFHSPTILGAFVLGAPKIAQPGADLWQRYLLSAVSSILSFAVAGALTYGVLGELRGRPARFGALLEFGVKNLWRSLLVSLLAGFFIVLGMVALLVPGVIFALMLSVAVPVAVTEPQHGVWGALTRSRELTRGHRLALLLVFLVVYVVVAVPVIPLSTATVYVPALQGGLAYGAITLVSAVLGSLFSTCQAVAYHDLRVAKEGVGTEALAAVFD